MGRNSDYDSGIYEEKKKEIDPEVVKGKIGNTEIDAAELAAFLYKYGRRFHSKADKTIRRKIKEICQKSNGLLNEDDFKKKVDGTEKYVFKPDIQAFIITLIDSTYLMDRANKRKLKTRNMMLEDMVTNVEIYMSQNDKKIIESNPAYLNAKLECLFTSAINKQLSTLVRELYHADEVVRLQEMKEVLDKLVEMNNLLGCRNAHLYSSKMVYGHVFDEDEDGEFKKALLQSDSIGDFLVHLLSLKMKGKEYEYLNDDEELSYPALWVATKMYEFEVMPILEGDIKLSELDAVVGNDERFKQIEQKAREVFNLNDPYEKLMYINVIRQAKTYYAAPYVSEKDYERTVKFVEYLMADTKWELLQKFLDDKDWDNSYLQELQRIDSLRGLKIEPDIS